MAISSRVRRMTMIGATALTLGLAGISSAPAHADTAIPTATTSVSNPGGIVAKGAYVGPTTPGVEAVIFPDDAGCQPGCLYATAGSSYYVTWRNNSGEVVMETRFAMQSDGNFVFYNLAGGKTWGAATRAADNPSGPGYSVTWQTDGNLVVRNSAGKAIWASNTHTYSHAILAMQDDGNLVIYPTRTDFQALWASHTNS